MYKHSIVSAVTAFILTGIIHAETWYVHPDSSLNTIQNGLDSCATDDTVIVAPGLYYENIVWPNTQGLHLISETIPEETIIDGDSAGSVIYIADSEAAEINGFTIQHGLHIVGGGLFLSGVSPIISNNIITNNTATNSGGGIYSNNGAPIVRDNIITHNTCDGGSGGGLAFYWGFNAELHRNIIIYNTGLGSGNTGGVYCALGIVIIDSCDISYNNGHGIFARHLMDRQYLPAVHYNNIVGNTGYGVYNDYEGHWLSATYNWWGDPSGPGGFGPGTGDEVSDWVWYTPWLTDSFTLCEEQNTQRCSIFYLKTYPNPFKYETNITWQSDSEGIDRYCIAVYDATGRKIREYLRPSNIKNMANKITWIGDDEVGREVPSGVYFIELKSDCRREKAMVIKLH